jgi:hypothetical protein
MAVVAFATWDGVEQRRLDAATQQNHEVPMFSLIALYLSSRRRSTVPAMTTATLAPIAVNDRDAVPSARAA